MRVSVVAFLLLGGCAGVVTGEQMEKINVACGVNNAKIKRVAVAECANPQILAANAQAGGGAQDLLGAWLAKRTELAEKIDKKKITKAEAYVVLQEYGMQLTNVATQRQAERSRALTESLIQQQMIQETFYRPAPRSVNCTSMRIGTNMVNTSCQ